MNIDQIMVAITVVVFLALWVRNRFFWLTSYLTLVVFGLINDTITTTALITAGLLAILLFQASKKTKHLLIYLTATVIIGLGLGLHVIPGFNNYIFAENILLSEKSATFDIWFNYDKSINTIWVSYIIFMGY